ncbi:gcvH [Symbiodinium microadriaticum]|nr:gcvH [Symbiodinium microadriaticum]
MLRRFAPLVQKVSIRTAQTQIRTFSLKFAETHEYISMQGDIGTVGISKHAADTLGDVVFVELPNVGDKFEQGESFGAVESVKAASDVYMPVAGEIVEINNVLGSTPETVNESPFGTGWFVKIKVASEGTTQLSELMAEGDYKQYVEDL